MQLLRSQVRSSFSSVERRQALSVFMMWLRKQFLASTGAGGTRVTLTFSGSLTNGFELWRMQLSADSSGAKVKAIDSQLAFDGNGDGVAGGDLVYGAQLAYKFFCAVRRYNGDGTVGVAEFGISVRFW